MTKHVTSHKYRNTDKLYTLSHGSWEAAEASGLINLYADSTHDKALRHFETGHVFHNMSSYSYLGLNRHPTVIQSAIDALEQERITGLGITPTRIQPSLHLEAQDGMSDLFNAKCLLSLSCTVATVAILPLISSGHLIDGKPRAMVFDKKAHFCMDMMKPICADEAEVFTCPHNDLDFLEDVCRRNERVAYIADGAYSMGGTAKLDELLFLQEKYGLFLWFDDSHSLAIVGDQGQGFVRSALPELSPLTVISASLEKGFGCTGGVLMFHPEQDTSFLNTFAGPMCWSQSINVAGLGSILGALKVHLSPELGILQKKLRKNIDLFDEDFSTGLENPLLPVRPIQIGDTERAISISRELYEHGFYVAPVYFPITSRGREGLRVMIRADINTDEYDRFRALLSECLST